MTRVQPYPMAVTLSFIFLTLYLVCVVIHIALPGSGWPMFRFLEMILVGFTWLSTTSLLLGFLEVFLAGFYVAYVLIPLYNYVNKRYLPREGKIMRPLRFKPVALASFGVITYVLCIIVDFIIPQWRMDALWEMLLPGFTWITFGSFFIGLIGVIAYGFYTAAVFVPVYNYFRGDKLPEI